MLTLAVALVLSGAPVDSGARTRAPPEAMGVEWRAEPRGRVPTRAAAESKPMVARPNARTSVPIPSLRGTAGFAAAAGLFVDALILQAPIPSLVEQCLDQAETHDSIVAGYDCTAWTFDPSHQVESEVRTLASLRTASLSLMLASGAAAAAGGALRGRWAASRAAAGLTRRRRAGLFLLAIPLALAGSLTFVAGYVQAHGGNRWYVIDYYPDIDSYPRGVMQQNAADLEKHLALADAGALMQAVGLGLVAYAIAYKHRERSLKRRRTRSSRRTTTTAQQ